MEAEQRRVEAEEAKRQQELLIDITSYVSPRPSRRMLNSKTRDQESHLESHADKPPAHIPEVKLTTYCSSLVKTNLISLQEQLELSIANKTGFNPTKQLLTTINEDLEALESIYQCGLSQERISNDVLSLGRIQLGESSIFHREPWLIRQICYVSWISCF